MLNDEDWFTFNTLFSINTESTTLHSPSEMFLKFNVSLKLTLTDTLFKSTFPTFLTVTVITAFSPIYTTSSVELTSSLGFITSNLKIS